MQFSPLEKEEADPLKILIIVLRKWASLHVIYFPLCRIFGSSLKKRWPWRRINCCRFRLDGPKQSDPLIGLTWRGDGLGRRTGLLSVLKSGKFLFTLFNEKWSVGFYLAKERWTKQKESSRSSTILRIRMVILLFFFWTFLRSERKKTGSIRTRSRNVGEPARVGEKRFLKFCMWKEQ